ncbi:Uncharacterised protein [Streptococcus dysgalactiae subsp. equisimilis]|nr:hypothetical protein AN454_22995 [Pseudomonas aeruginosa]VTS66714.1 Uncharacterised protein [Streptococcus dysgalactiae subsp. equisimilis]
MSSFQGIWVPLVTPFRHGEIDFVALPCPLDHLLDAGALLYPPLPGGAGALLPWRRRRSSVPLIVYDIPYRTDVRPEAGSEQRHLPVDQGGEIVADERQDGIGHRL